MGISGVGFSMGNPSKIRSMELSSRSSSSLRSLQCMKSTTKSNKERESIKTLKVENIDYHVCDSGKERPRGSFSIRKKLKKPKFKTK